MSDDGSQSQAKIEELKGILTTIDGSSSTKAACDEITAFVTSKQAEDGLVCNVPTNVFLNTGSDGGCACRIS